MKKDPDDDGIEGYNPEWESDDRFSSWIEASTRGPNFTYCRICQVHFKTTGASSMSLLEQHASMEKHKKKIAKSEKKLNNSTKVFSTSHDANYSSNEGIPASELIETLSQSNETISHEYSKDWESEPSPYSSWATSSELGESYAHCKLCDKPVFIKNSGELALQKHAQAKRHKKKDGSTTIKKRHLNHYQPRWEMEPAFIAWLSESEKGIGFAYCKACDRDLAIRLGGKTDLISHSKTRKHQKLFKVYPNKPEESLIYDNEFLLANIHSILPMLGEDAAKKVVDHLVNDVGVEVREDLLHVETSDLAGILKPIQARKLVKKWQQEFAPTPKQLPFPHPPSVEGSPAKRNIVLSETPGTSVPYIVNIGSDFQMENSESFFTSGSKNEKNEFSRSKQIPNTSVEGSCPTFKRNQDMSNSHELSMPYIVDVCSEIPMEHQATVTHSKFEYDRRVERGEWVDDFSIPSNAMSSELLNALQMSEPPSKTKLRELIKVLADSIYKITKKPRIDQLKTIADRITQEFPCLLDRSLEANSPYEAFLVKLRNRIYTLGREKSRLLRAQRKKEEKLKAKVPLISNSDQSSIPEAQEEIGTLSF